MTVIHQDLWQGFAAIARYYGMAVNIAALREKYAVDAQHDIRGQFVRAVRETGLKCRNVRLLSDMRKLPLPILAEIPGEGYVLLLAVSEGEWLIQRSETSSPERYVPLSTERYTGFLFARRFSLERLTTEFNLHWFASAFWRYKKLMGEVLLASFFIQILALVARFFSRLWWIRGWHTRA